MKLKASFPKSDFSRLKILQIMFFFSYQTQNLGFAFLKCALYLLNGIPNGHTLSSS
jgi:hypothetical protein